MVSDNTTSNRRSSWIVVDWSDEFNPVNRYLVDYGFRQDNTNSYRGSSWIIVDWSDEFNPVNRYLVDYGFLLVVL